MQLELHHIGVATKNIEKDFLCYKNLGYQKESDLFYDKIQKINGLFIVAKNQPRLELLQNAEIQGPLTSCLKNGIKYYHLAYLTKNIENTAKEFELKTNAKLIVPIIEAEFFEKICFYMLSNMSIIEFVQERVK